MSRETFKKTWRFFEVFPYAGTGIVNRLSGDVKEYVDKNGYRVIRNVRGEKVMISHIIYAVGSNPRGFPLSYKKLKNFIIKYKDGNKLNCNFDNLICIEKKSYKKRKELEKQLGEFYS